LSDAGVQLNENYQLYKSIRIHQANAEETFILPTLGQTIGDLLYTKILANNLSTDEKALLKKVQKPLAAFTMAEAIRSKAISLDADGVFQLSETVGGISGNVENRNPPSDQLLHRAACGFTMRGEQELETLRQFLSANANKYSYTIPTAVKINDGSAPNIYFM